MYLLLTILATAGIVGVMTSTIETHPRDDSNSRIIRNACLCVLGLHRTTEIVSDFHLCQIKLRFARINKIPQQIRIWIVNVILFLIPAVCIVVIHAEDP